MEALILCGGFAKRLEPITLFVPKPLLPIGGRPILDHIVDSLPPEVSRVIISSNKKFGNQFKYWMDMKRASGTRQELELVVEPTIDNGKKFGAIKGIQYAIKKIGIEDDLLVIAGDNFYNSRIEDLIDYFKKSGRKTTICIHDVGSIEEAKKLGVVEMEGERIKAFEEKPDEPRSTMVSTVIYMLPKEILPKIDEYLSGENNPDAPGYFLKWLLGSTEIRGLDLKGEWFDIGNLETYGKVYTRFNDALNGY